MKTTRKHYTEPLSDGRTLEFWQDDNGMHRAEIRDWQDAVEAATIQPTQADVWRWLIDYSIN